MAEGAKILVVGGAGYIGSHMVKLLLEQGFQVVVLDNLATGYRDAVLGGEFVAGDLADRELLDLLLAGGGFTGVMHFASFIQVGESMLDPAAYYRNNFCNTQNLLDAMVRHRCGTLIFSSSAAIFGEPEYTPIDEGHRKEPLNPYGRTKLMVEQMLADYDRAYGLRSVSLRYFNAAGADPQGRLGERHQPETHLIPLVLQVAAGRRQAITVYGRDYPTPDTTCVRDYIHINDLCSAHLLALRWVQREGRSGAFNLGNGSGFSVQEVITAARRVTGREIAVVEGARRPGDPAILVADASLARATLGWVPQFPELETILAHAWRWERFSCGGCPLPG